MKRISKAIAGLLLSVFVGSRPVLAGTFIQSIDSHDDGVEYLERGATLTGVDSQYETYDASAIVTEEEIILHLDTNLPIEGVKDSRAADGHIGHGDIFIETQAGTYGIKYAPNGTSLPVGIYKDVVGYNAAGENYGLQAQANDPTALTNIINGNRIGDVMVYAVEGVEGAGTSRIVVVFNRDLLPAGESTFTFTQECNNDIAQMKALVPDGSVLPKLLAAPDVKLPDVSSESGEVILGVPIPTIPEIPGSGSTTALLIAGGTATAVIVLLLLLGGEGAGDNGGILSIGTSETPGDLGTSGVQLPETLRTAHGLPGTDSPVSSNTPSTLNTPEESETATKTEVPEPGTVLVLIMLVLTLSFRCRPRSCSA